MVAMAAQKMRLSILVMHILVMGAVTTVAEKINYMKIPYEVEQSLIEMTNPAEKFRGLDRVNISSPAVTRPIYRKDLDQGYIAYYEIEADGQYLLLSTGPGTGDYRDAQSGPAPRPTDVLIKEAGENGQKCAKFFCLSPSGLFMCENEQGRAVAATFNWVSDSPLEHWRQLDGMVQKDLESFAELWREKAKLVKADHEWLLTELLRGKQRPKLLTDEQAVKIGSVVKLAVEKDFKEVKIYFRDLGNRRRTRQSFVQWQWRLCRVLIDLCHNSGTFVNKDKIKTTQNGFPYIEFKVHSDAEFVQKTLKNKEVGFVIVVTSRSGETVVKHYAIDMQSRFKRDAGYTSWKESAIHQEWLFPSYSQHKCCGCLSGCVPVAWAQVFAYFDRLAHSNNHWKNKCRNCQNLWRCGDGSPKCKAPSTLTSAAKKYVENLRTKLKTRCKKGSGSTSWKNYIRVESWFKGRLGNRGSIGKYPKVRVSRSLERSRRTTIAGYKKWYLQKAIDAVKAGYPAVVSIKVVGKKGKSGHAVVATRYRGRYKKYRTCFLGVCGKWKKKWQHRFYLRFGWSKKKADGWYEALARGVCVAKPW